MSSFFKKPSWAQKNAPDKPVEFYRRSNRVYSDLVAPESDDSSGHRERSATPSTPTKSRKTKRRRVSREDEEATVAAKIPRKTPSSQSASGNEDITETNGSTSPSRRLAQPAHSPAPKLSPTLSHTRNNTTPSKSKITPNTADAVSRTPPAIAILDSEPAPASENDGDDESEEEEYADLARRARERARKRQAQPTSITRKPPTDKKNHDTPDKTKHTTRSDSSRDGNGTPREEPVVQILIMSDIENTKPLIVRRKLSQNLADVRKAWCERQGFSEQMTSSIFLTWKGRRLFDVTTCKSLGIKDVEDTVFSSREGAFSNGDGVDGIHMEAMTLDMFEEQRRQAAMASFRGTGEKDENSDVQEQKQPEETLSLTLKNPKLNDLKLKVQPTTQIAKIVSSFRKKRKIPAEKSVMLLFDGDRLNPNSLVKDNDMADLDCVDVILK